MKLTELSKSYEKLVDVIRKDDTQPTTYKVKDIENLLEFLNLDKDEALRISAKYGNNALVDYYMNLGANVNSGLLGASEGNQIHYVKMFVDNGADSINQALYWTAKYGFDNISLYLLEKGADIEYLENHGNDYYIQRLLTKVKE